MNATCAKDKIFFNTTGDRKFALQHVKTWWFHLACFRNLSCRYFDISLEAFLLTEFRTFGYNSDWFVIMLWNSCGIPVFATYLPNQTVSLFRGHFQGWFYKQLWLGGRLGEDYLYLEIGQDYRYFPSHMFEASGPNSKIYWEYLLLFVFVKSDNIRTDLRIWRFQQTLLY